MRRITVVAMFLAAGVALLGGSARTLGKNIPPGMMDLTGQLLQKHPYLLSDQQREALAELNRKMREADRQLRKSENEAVRDKAADALDAAASRVIEVLQRCSRVIPVKIVDGKARVTLSGPVMLPGDSGALLLQVESRGDAVRCVALMHDMSEQSGPVIPLDIGASGTTWVLVGLTNVPARRSSLRIDFKLGPERTIGLPVQVVTPPSGRLKVTVLSADSGQPTPAMIRLVCKADGVDRPPSTAIEFAPQFDHQGKSTGRRPARYFGRLATEFWCVPEPFDMVLPAGQWEIIIRRGVEHIPVFDTFTVRPGQVTVKRYQPKRWVDMPKHGWYSGDDHVHCRIMSDDDARRLMAWVRAEDIHLANIVKMGDIHRTWFEQRGWGEAHRVIDGDYILSPGQECPRTHSQLGHTLAMNTRSMIRDTDQYFLYDRVFDAVHAQGGLSGYAHVNRDMFFVHRDMSINLPKGKVDFAEILQFAKLGTELYYVFLNIGFKLTASAGSDVPWGGTVGEVRVYAYLGDQPFTADAWFEAVRRGRTFVSNGPMLEFRVDDARPGDEIAVEPGRKLRVRARVWGHPDRVMPTRLEIVRHGEVIRSAESADDDQAELTLDFEVDAGDGFWIAARAEGRQGERAHTTPVYVARKGLRFWKFDQIDALLDRGLGYLDEVEKIVAKARRRNDAGELELDRTRKQLALQGPALLERVAAARAIYHELRQTARRERSLRNKSD